MYIFQDNNGWYVLQADDFYRQDASRDITEQEAQKIIEEQELEPTTTHAKYSQNYSNDSTHIIHFRDNWRIVEKSDNK